MALLFAACSARPPVAAPAPIGFTTAEQAFQHGDYQRARKAYRIFLDHPSDDAYVPRAWYKLALCDYRRQEYRAALGALDQLAARYPDDTWPQAETLRGDANLALGNKVSALQSWASAWRVADEHDRVALRRRFDHAVETLSRAERENAQEIIANPTIRTWLERPPAPPAASTPATRQPAPRTSSAAALPAAPRARGHHIGCLLPLSGRYRIFGERSLQGIQLAFAGEPDVLVVKDTRGDAATARAAFAELAARSDIVGVLGPLTGGAAAAAAPLAQPAGLPLVLLTQREQLANRYVLQPVMTRTRQAELLARVAVRQHWRHVGILAPDDDYGRSFGERFRVALERLGGRVTWNEQYPAHQGEATAQIAQARERFRRGVLDAVFLPDAADAAITIGAALRAAMPGVGLLGPNGWNDPEALSGAGHRLDGAIFVAGFFPASARPATRSFVETFRRVHQATPDVLAAQAYDAATLLRESLRRGASSRESVLLALHELGSVSGATGEIAVSAAGASRSLYVLRIGAGHVEELLY